MHMCAGPRPPLPPCVLGCARLKPPLPPMLHTYYVHSPLEKKLARRQREEMTRLFIAVKGTLRTRVLCLQLDFYCTYYLH